MKVRKASWPVKEKLDPPRMIGGVKTNSYDKIANVDAVRVDELIAWCKDNPDVTTTDLALSLEQGAFS